MRFKAKYFCVRDDDVCKRSNIIKLDFTTDKYDTMYEEVKKASSWDGDIVIYEIRELNTNLEEK